jgi:hypothetical protein
MQILPRQETIIRINAARRRSLESPPMPAGTTGFDQAILARKLSNLGFDPVLLDLQHRPRVGRRSNG